MNMLKMEKVMVADDMDLSSPTGDGFCDNDASLDANSNRTSSISQQLTKSSLRSMVESATTTATCPSSSQDEHGDDEEEGEQGVTKDATEDLRKPSVDTIEASLNNSSPSPLGRSPERMAAASSPVQEEPEQGLHQETSNEHNTEKKDDSVTMPPPRPIVKASSSSSTQSHSREQQGRVEEGSRVDAPSEASTAMEAERAPGKVVPNASGDSKSLSTDDALVHKKQRQSKHKASKKLRRRWREEAKYRKLFQDSIMVSIPLSVTGDLGVVLQRTRPKRIKALYDTFPSLTPVEPKPESKAADKKDAKESEQASKHTSTKDGDVKDGTIVTAPVLNGKKKLKHMPRPEDYDSILDYLEAKYVQGVMLDPDEDEDDDEKAADRSPSGDEGEGSVYSETSFLDDTDLQLSIAEQVLAQQTTTKVELANTGAAAGEDSEFFVNVGNLEVEETDLTTEDYNPLGDTNTTTSTGKKDSKKKKLKKKEAPTTASATSPADTAVSSTKTAATATSKPEKKKSSETAKASTSKVSATSSKTVATGTKSTSTTSSNNKKASSDAPAKGKRKKPSSDDEEELKPSVSAKATTKTVGKEASKEEQVEKKNGKTAAAGISSKVSPKHKKPKLAASLMAPVASSSSVNSANNDENEKQSKKKKSKTEPSEPEDNGQQTGLDAEQSAVLEATITKTPLPSASDSAEIFTLFSRVLQKRAIMDEAYKALVKRIHDAPDSELPRRKTKDRVALTCPPDKKPGDAILFSNPHVPGQRLKVKIPKNTLPGGTFKVTVPVAPAGEGSNDDDVDHNKFSRSFYDVLDEYGRTYDEWCDMEAEYRKAKGGEDNSNFATHSEKRKKFDNLQGELPKNLKTPMDRQYMQKILRRARQNRHKRELTARRKGDDGSSRNQGDNSDTENNTYNSKGGSGSVDNDNSNDDSSEKRDSSPFVSRSGGAGEPKKKKVKISKAVTTIPDLTGSSVSNIRSGSPVQTNTSSTKAKPALKVASESKSSTSTNSKKVSKTSLASKGPAERSFQKVFVPTLATAFPKISFRTSDFS